MIQRSQGAEASILGIRVSGRRRGSAMWRYVGPFQSPKYVREPLVYGAETDRD